jgi:hypothetical protein
MVDGELILNDLRHEGGKRAAVDFFRTLADTHGSDSTAIVLSGADSDGALGIKRIKENGGLTVAQEPGEAEYEGMPLAAIATGMVDWVLPVAEMPRGLVEYQRSKSEFAYLKRTNLASHELRSRLMRMLCAKRFLFCGCAPAMTFPPTNEIPSCVESGDACR